MNKLMMPFLILLLISCNQTTKNQINPNKYIDLVYYKEKSNNNIFSHISFDIKKSEDSIGVFINNHNNRIGYFISNNIKADTLEKLYPDTLQITKLFTKQINEKQFISNFSKLVNPQKQPKDIYSWNEIMKVASRFFVVVNSGNDFRLKICGGGNDFSDLNAIKDVSLIEAITYEALISAFDKENSERPKFISSARVYFSNAIKNPDSLSNKAMLISAKNKLYMNMEKDESLKLFINGYLIENSNNLPFKIDRDK